MGLSMRVVVLVLALCLGAAQPAPAQTPGPTLRVTGTGEASATPDIARLSAGVRAEAATAAAALDAASRAMAGIRATLDAAQIAPSDIQTTSLSLTPVWNTASGSMPGQPEIAGYRARNMVTVTVRDLDALGGLLDAVAQAGANEIGAIRFSAWSRSAIRSSASSIPMDTRTTLGAAPAATCCSGVSCRCVVEAE
jgi:uncharacterized protein YggE